jgi:hypothetical protein
VPAGHSTPVLRFGQEAEATYLRFSVAPPGAAATARGFRSPCAALRRATLRDRYCFRAPFPGPSALLLACLSQRDAVRFLLQPQVALLTRTIGNLFAQVHAEVRIARQCTSPCERRSSSIHRGYIRQTLCASVHRPRGAWLEQSIHHRPTRFNSRLPCQSPLPLERKPTPVTRIPGPRRPYDIGPHHATSCHIMPRPCHLMPHHATSCHTMPRPCRIASCHIIPPSFHAMPCH